MKKLKAVAIGYTYATHIIDVYADSVFTGFLVGEMFLYFLLCRHSLNKQWDENYVKVKILNLKRQGGLK